MNRKYLPIMLDVTERSVLILGGGKAAAEKLRTLDQLRPRTRAIALDFLPIFDDYPWITREKRAYRTGDLDGADVVYCGVNDRVVEAAVAREAKERKILINFIDDRDISEFISASVLAREHFSIFISSYGRSPGAVKQIRQLIESNLNLDDLDRMVSRMAEDRLRARPDHKL
ncbi:MAG: hypothetical protein HS115_13480 [Spirochaetales bacterium]|nr:hypothetical protein [Spirochaetales bacterium]